MSTLMTSSRTGARARVPRFAEAAVERARLTVVPPRRPLGRTQAARTPFAVLVLAMLAGGVVGLLMFNTHMQQSSFEATALQRQVSVLTAQKQSLDLELDRLRDPQRLAVAAKDLGMVAPSQPAFVRLGDGTVLGNPTPATRDDAVRINPLPRQLPAELRRRTIVVKVPAAAAAAGVAKPGERSAPSSVGDTRGASAPGTREEGRTGATTSSGSGATP